MGVRYRIWDILYALLLIIAVPISIFHFVQDRPAQGLIAIGASIAGAWLIYTGWNEPTPVPARRRVRADAEKRVAQPVPRVNGRIADWGAIGLISGFAATGVMTVVILAGYAISAAASSMLSSSSTFGDWFQSLISNTITETTTVNLPLAIVIHLLAGLTWALIYSRFIEPALNGPGWLQGITFSLLPWLLSLFVFFPLAGGGFAGFGLGAGPLPLIGNLIAHAAYGAVLGQLVLSQAFLTESGSAESSVQASRIAASQRAMAMSILPGIMLGALVGLVGSGIIAPSAEPTMIAAAGAVIGSVGGILIGSLVGLSPHPEAADSARNS